MTSAKPGPGATPPTGTQGSVMPGRRDALGPGPGDSLRDVRAPDVYRLLRAEWSADLSQAGLAKVPRSACAWWTARPGYNLLLMTYVDPRGWDPHAGSSFVVDYEATDRREFGWQPKHRGRLGEALDDAALSAVLRLQNDVISRLRPPSVEELGLEEHDPDADYYLSEFFSPLTALVPGDLHFRYYDEKDVRAWSHLLRGWLVPELLAFEQRWLASGGPTCLRRVGYSPSSTRK
jgi:hypothetical protein